MSNSSVTTAFGTVLNPIVTNILNPIVELAFAVALIVFVYGVMQVIVRGVNSAEYDNGKRSMWGGLIGMFIMLSAWGLINIVANTVKQF